MLSQSKHEIVFWLLQEFIIYLNKVIMDFGQTLLTNKYPQLPICLLVILIYLEKEYFI